MTLLGWLDVATAAALAILSLLVVLSAPRLPRGLTAAGPVCLE